ncbi:MAG: ABC transporter substrate-binding protein, partial [Propionibacteriaceae bacterium]|nr:ABC transporter substrate-binding protein [Propionibacteriaceae bacterium]
MLRALRPPAMVLATALLAAGLAACSSPSGGSTTSDTGTPVTTSAAAPEEIRLWSSWKGSDLAAAQTLIDQYNASQTQYKVVHQFVDPIQQSLLTAEASGSGVPDLVVWDRFSTSLYASKGALMPLDDLIAAKGIDTSQFYQEALKELTYQGGTYGLPLTVDVRVIFYNKTLLAAAGLQPPTTWAELKQAASALTTRDASGTLTQSGFQVQDAGLFSIWCLQAGCQLVNADQTATAFNSPAGRSVLDFWGDLLFTSKVYDLGFADGSDPFAAGTLAMMYDGPWDIGKYNDVAGLEWGAVAPPAGPNGDRGAIMGGMGLVIPTGAKNTDGAFDFMTWWTDATQAVVYSKASGVFPGNQKATEDPYFQTDQYKPFVEALAFAKIRPTVAGYSDVEGQALTPQLQKFMAGEIDAATALSTAQTLGD